MKILLINPNWALNEFRYTMAVLNPYKITPLELCYIAGSINKNHEVKIIDSYALEDSWLDLKEKIKAYKPDICVVTTAPTYLFWRCCPLEMSIPQKVTKIIKLNSKAKVIIIGPHGTITPNEVFKKIDCDIVINGESDLIVPEIINNGLKEIINKAGVSTKEHISLQVAMVNNLNDLPLPRLDLLDLKLYEPHIWVKDLGDRVRKKSGYFILAESSRGCPKNCVFCQRELFRKAYREKSAERMKAEIDYYKKIGVSYIYFIDETGSIFTSDKKEWLEYLEKKCINFGVEAIIDQTSIDVINRLKKAGCIYLEYGLETIDRELHKMMSKNLLLKNLEYAKKEIDTVVCFELNFYSHDYIEILGIKNVNERALFNRPIIPYPASFLGKQLLRKYNVKNNIWDFVLRYTWWLQLEYFFIENDIKNIGFSQDYFFKPYKENLKNLILSAPLTQVKELVYSILDFSSFWAKNSSGFRD